MSQKLTKALSAFICVLLILSMTTTAFAAGNAVDFSKKGTISVTLKNVAGQHETVYGASFRLYKIATVTSENNQLLYNLTLDFAKSGIALNDLKAQGLAERFAEYAQQNKLKARIEKAAASGKVTFSGLDLGLYLLVQDGAIENYYPVDPFLVSVPMTNADGTAWIYDVDASPKVQVKPNILTKITVKKVWESAGDNNRPQSITVELLNGEARYGSVTLSATNNWTYTWNSLPVSNKWQVKEVNVPANYKVSYSIDGMNITVKNTYTPNKPNDPKKPPLIQTGQLNWPIPALTGVGLMLIIIGWALLFKKRER